MSLKTTLLLVLLVATGGLVLWFSPSLAPWLGLSARPRPAATDGTLATLERELTPAKLTRIEIHKGDRMLTLDRTAGDWTLPGKWPARGPEVQNLVDLLTGLRSRFAPIPAPDDDALAKFGLDKPMAKVIVSIGEKPYALAFSEGEQTDGASRFSVPTYLRLDDRQEIVRLAPGIVGVLDRPAEYYQQRRLFIDTARVAKTDNPEDKTEQLAAQVIATAEHQPGGNAFTLKKAGAEWELTQPVRDRVDPEKVTQVLTAIPDLWAEQFVANPKPDLAEYGLKEPEQAITVTRPNGDVVVLQIGKKSDTKKMRTVTKPAPPGVPGLEPTTITVPEEFRYAKLQNNSQIFEIKTDKLKDIFLATKDLRDPRLARFEPKEVSRLEIKQNVAEIVLLREMQPEKEKKDPAAFAEQETAKWRLEKPIQAEADSTKVTELLNDLSRLEARDPDILDGKDAKTYGLADGADTAEIRIVAEQEIKGADGAKVKKERTFVFRFGKQDADKLYAQVQGVERINVLKNQDQLVSLVKRPALAYRGRRVLDFNTAALETLEIERAGEKIKLKQDKGAWKLLTPTSADADSIKAGQLAGNLSRLEAVEFINDNPKPDELEKVYGLDKPSLQATIQFSDATKPPQKLLLGKQREKHFDYYAKLDDRPSVFVVRRELHDALDQGSLSYRPLQLWQMPSSDVAAIRVQKEGQEEYTLKRQGNEWRIAGPFEATALPMLAQPAAQQLAELRCQKYETADAADLQPFGLDKPYLRLTLIPIAQPDAKDAPKERTLLIGKPDDKGGRFAKLGENDEKAVFVIGQPLVAATDHAALDLIDRHLISLAPEKLLSVDSKSGDGSLKLEKKDGLWQVAQSPAGTYAADAATANIATRVWANLSAKQFAAYGPNADLAKFGLDKPDLTVNVTTQSPAADGKKPEPVTHTLTLGKDVEGSAGERYARLDAHPGVAILPAPVVTELTRNYLGFVNHDVLQLDAAKVQSVLRHQGPDNLELTKNDEGWQLVKPTALRADDETLQTLVEQLSSLRAVRVAAYPVKDLKAFGLDTPAAEITLRSPGADGKAAEHTLKLGKPADESSGDRFALVEGGQTVFVLPGSLANRLVAAPVAFRNRNLARFPDADRVVLERGARKAVFTKVDGTWKLTDPLEAQAEHTDMEEFLFGKGGVAKLQADELVAEKPADLKPYGLDKPEARWHFFSGDKEVMNLAIGARDKEGERCYAQIAGIDLVFLLKPALTTRALAEYRTRSVWSVPPDAALVDRIRFQYAANPFVLEMADGSWSVAAKPDVMLNTRAVNETLAALAELKVEHYVVDKAADLALYGLDKPHLVLEVQTPTGKRVLHIGRAAGESKRYYAQAPDKATGEVFVLSEADSAKIVRDLAAFTQRK
ncbi:MAG TPA: DUF4340 domain-containing protein [Gemmataceae bacterium]